MFAACADEFYSQRAKDKAGPVIFDCRLSDLFDDDRLGKVSKRIKVYAEWELNQFNPSEKTKLFIDRIKELREQGLTTSKMTVILNEEFQKELTPERTAIAVDAINRRKELQKISDDPESFVKTNHTFEMVEVIGNISNHSVLDELVKWGAIIENMRGISDGCDIARK